MGIQSLHDWFQTPLGSFLLARERAWLESRTPDIFGFHAMQLGLPKIDLLSESRIAHKFIVDPSASHQVRAHYHELPIETQSVDLCVLGHVLEFSEQPHEILREIDRVLIPEGRLLITGFNPWSLLGLKRLWAADAHPWNGHFVSLVRMKDWLQLLGFEVSAGHLAGYLPPCDTARWVQRWHFLESMGDRWWGVAGGIYMLEAIKRVQGMRIITPKWTEVSARERKYAATAKRDIHVFHRPRVSRHLKLIK